MQAGGGGPVGVGRGRARTGNVHVERCAGQGAVGGRQEHPGSKKVKFRFHSMY